MLRFGARSYLLPRLIGYARSPDRRSTDRASRLGSLPSFRFGSETGAAKRSQVRPDAVIVAIPGFLTCPDACYQAPRSHARFVVVLDVMSSVRSALRARACRIRAETRRRGYPPPVSLPVSGPLSAASPVVYKTAALPAELHRRETLCMVAGPIRYLSAETGRSPAESYITGLARVWRAGSCVARLVLVSSCREYVALAVRCQP